MPTSKLLSLTKELGISGEEISTVIDPVQKINHLIIFHAENDTVMKV